MSEPSKPRIPTPKAVEHHRNLLESEPDEAAQKYLRELQREQRLDRLTRRLLAPFVLFVVSGWLLVIIALLFLEGWHVKGFDLGDGVLIAAIGATALFGLLGIVLRHYFPRRGDGD